MTATRPKGISLASILLQLLPSMALVAIFSGIGVMHVRSRVAVVDSGYRLSQLESQNRALALENSRLKLELATLKSPERLGRIARTQLGMGPASPEALIAPGAVPHRPARAPLSRSPELASILERGP